MASDINRVMLIGRMVRDPELKYTQGGSSVTNFSIANNRSYTVSGEKKEMVSFFNCVAWAKTGEVIAQYCKKGQRIAIEGRLQQRSWDDQSGNKRSTVEIVVENFQFLSGKDDGGRQAEHQDSQDVGPPPQGSGESTFGDDDIPF
ncbi:MAG: single-stranded DNA-binding protein [Spirochaetes bacterium]|jgi:single-strand DNA-binding protein|nr:single-stranded DNA-binding protein [Spirochaetota bacterium]